MAAKEHPQLKLILGTEIRLQEGLKLVLLATDRRSYGAISSLITIGRRRSKKGSYSLSRTDVEALRGKEVLVLWIAEDFGHAEWLAKAFPGAARIAPEPPFRPNCPP